jgi:hypothetical protein
MLERAGLMCGVIGVLDFRGLMTRLLLLRRRSEGWDSCDGQGHGDR